MEEDNTDGKKKTTPPIPANYISILQLQERWINEKEKKCKEEEEERRRKQQAEEEQKIEEDLKKVEEARGQMEEEKRLNRSNRKHSGWKKNGGGGARFVEKEKQEVTAAIWSERGEEDTAEILPEKNRGFRRKRYNSKTKKNQDVAVVVEDVVDCGCVAIAPSESVVTENVTPVKDVIRVYKKKSVVTDAATAIETQFEDLSINRGETNSSKRNRAKAHQRVKMPVGAASMVWVKKERPNDGIASGVKPFNA